MQDCIFCKIVNNELPSKKIYEDENFLVILDIAYVNKGHALIIPKIHSETILDTDEKVLEKVGYIFKIIGNALMKATNCGGFNIIQNNFKVANQIVPHLHFHIIPRFEGDNLPMWEQHQYKEQEADEILEKIKKEII
jgi:histidine triad (HIT) family protein